LKKLKVLAFGAHPDDIEVLCGGTLAKYYKQGHKVSIAIATNGGAGHPTMAPKEIIEIRKKEAAEAAKVIDAELYWLGIDDQFLIDDRETRIIFINAIRKSKPDVILTSHFNDYHHDHRMTGELVFKTIVSAHLPGVKTEVEPCESIPVLYYYDSLNGLNFIPDIYTDITDTLDVKKEMLSKHESQLAAMREILKADLYGIIEINAMYRGLQCNARYAEGFKKADSYLMTSSQRLLP
jgi:LmbE family N-acetylglucosaminyl deacetylase